MAQHGIEISSERRQYPRFVMYSGFLSWTQFMELHSGGYNGYGYSLGYGEATSQEHRDAARRLWFEAARRTIAGDYNSTDELFVVEISVRVHAE